MKRRIFAGVVGLYFAWLVAVVMLGFAVTGKHPYSFYILLRWICCAVFAISAVMAHKQCRDLWVWVFGALAALFNPIVPLHLQRNTWQVVDWSAIGVVVIAAISFWRDKGTEPTSKNMNEEKSARTFVSRHGNGESLPRSEFPASESGDSNELPEKHSSNPLRLRRTLWGAAIGALLAMALVPCIGHGYEPIFNAARYRINVAQLVLNVSFAALVGALASNFSRRAWRVLSWIAASVALVLTAWLGFSTFQQQMKVRAEREESIAWGAILDGNFDVAKQHLLNASNYWWWKGWWEGARHARERAFDGQEMNKRAAVFRAQKYEERAWQLLRGLWNNWYPSDADVTEAKRLLLEAAEKWHITGNTAAEERVRALEKNVKTEAGFKASLQWGEEEKLIHDPIDYQRGTWTAAGGQAFIYATFFERNLGDRKAELDALADRLGARKRYTLIEKQKRGGVWWVSVFLYRQATQTYVVQSGDTLVSISRKFYNSTDYGKAILDANRKNIRDPKKLTVGQRLIIP